MVEELIKELGAVYSNLEPVSVYGSSGFIGSHFMASSRFGTVQVPRNVRESPSPSIIYFLGTVDNYNVFTDPYLDINTNQTLLIETLEACRKRWGNFVFNFVSTWFVYGDTKLPYQENQECRPKGFYSITKYAAEMLLKSYCETFKCTYRIIRLGNVLGPNDKKTSKKKNAIQYMLGNLRANKDVLLYEDGKFVRDLIHVEDVVRGLDLILSKGQKNEVYNLSSGKPTVIGDLVKGYRDHIESKSRIMPVETPDFHKVVQVKDSVLDITKISALGFKTNIEFSHQVLETL